MDCVFIRHGMAVEQEEWDGLEEHRPLTEKGKKRVQQAAAGLASLNLLPTHFLSSPFVRARETATVIRAVLRPSIKVKLLDELAPGSTPERVFAILRTLPSDAVVICVGHEPLLGQVAGILLCGSPSQGFSLKKAGAACIHIADPKTLWQGLLRWWLQPGQLRALGKRKETGPHGKD